MDEKRSSNAAQRCSRCSVLLLAEYVFCTNCGERAKPHPAQLTAKPVLQEPKKEPLRLAPKAGISGSKRAANAQRKKKSSTRDGTLTLPPAVISKLDQLLARPALDDAMFTKRMVQQFQTQILEMRNAEGIEVATLYKHSSSLALDAPSIEGTAKYEVEPPSHYYSSSAHRSVTSAPGNETSIVSKPASKSVGQYLDNVESITTHYKAYLQRLKQLEGLRAAMMEAPAMPSELLQRQPSHSRQAPTTVASNGEEHEESMETVKSAEVPPQEPSTHTNSQISETDAPDPANTQIPTNNSGVAFMWGPIFNPGGSIADETIYSTIAERQSVVYLDADAVLSQSPGSSRRHNQSRESRQGSRASSPYRESFLSEKSGTTSPETGRSQKFRPISGSPSRTPQDSPTRSPSSPSPPSSADKQASKRSNSAGKVKEQAAAPVVMFWGNVLQAEQGAEEEENTASSPGGSSKFLSRAGSFLSQNSVHSIAEMQAFEESELPVWIETLAAETAELREEFAHEDAVIMQQVCERLNALDADSLHLQSQRALLVQYSMDAVVKEYWERIEQLKAGMRLQSTPLKLLNYAHNDESPGWSDDELDASRKEQEEDKIGAIPLLTAPTELQDDLRAPTEEEESVRMESLQSAQNHVAPTDKSSCLAALTSGTTSAGFYPVRVDRGAILHKHEKDEFRDAVNREKLQAHDEEAMQELILELTKAHQSKFIVENTSANDAQVNPAPSNTPSLNAGLSALEPKRSMAPEMIPPETSAEMRVSKLLHAWEGQENKEQELRDRTQESDELALKHWLVAVSAIDRDRATRQTLRTLQLEELEDNENEDSDEDSVHSATKRAGEASNQLESATIDVPENNSLSIIKTLYRQSCSKMLAFLSELTVDFNVDQTKNPHFRSEARTKLQFAKRILKASTNVDHKVALEYRNFLNYCAVRRTALAMKLSEEMQKASQLEQSYRERYAEATKEFKNSTEVHHGHSNSTNEAPPRHHLTSSKHMQAIKLSAEIDLRAQGEVVKRLQADEAKLLLDTRQEQFVLSEVLGLWQARHSRTLHTYSLAYKRLSGLVDSTQLVAPTPSASQT